MTELVRLSDVLKGQGLDLNSFIELIRSRDLQVLVEIPGSLDVYRVDEGTGSGGGGCHAIKEVDFRFIAMSPSQMGELAVKGEAEMSSARDLWKFESGSWKALSAEDIYWEEIVRAIEAKLDPANERGNARFYQGHSNLRKRKEFRFFGRNDNPSSASPQSFSVGMEMLWLPTRTRVEVETDLVAMADVEAIRKVLKLFPALFDNDLHDLANLTHTQRPFFGDINEAKIPESLIRKANIPPNWLLSLLAIALKYYERAEPGEPLSRYRSSMTADIERKDYWVRGSVFPKTSRIRFALILLVQRYANYAEARELESFDDRRSEARDLIKSDIDDGLEAFLHSGPALLAKIWLRFWKTADLACDEDGVWVENLAEYRALQEAVKSDIHNMVAAYMAQPFAVELAETRPWQFLLNQLDR